MLRALVLASLATFSLACGSVDGSPSPPAEATGGSINVTGTVDRAPMPTCPAGEPCDPHMVAVLLIFTDASGRQVSTRVGSDGSFRLRLDPGDYTIAAAPPAFGAALDPSRVRVPRAGSVTLHLHFQPSTLNNP